MFKFGKVEEVDAPDADAVTFGMVVLGRSLVVPWSSSSLGKRIGVQEDRLKIPWAMGYGVSAISTGDDEMVKGWSVEK